MGEDADAGRDGDIITNLNQPADAGIERDLFHDRTILAELKTALYERVERNIPAQSLNEPLQEAHVHSIAKNRPEGGFSHGGIGGDRTRDRWLKRPLLYQLSYDPKRLEKVVRC